MARIFALGSAIAIAAISLLLVATASAGHTAAQKPKPKVKASIHRGQLSVLGTAKSERIALRLKPGSRSRLQVDVGANGSADFTFKRSAFNRIVVHGASGADALSVNESYGAFTGSEATSIFGDAGNDQLRAGSGAERLFGGLGNDTVDGKRRQRPHRGRCGR